MSGAPMNLSATEQIVFKTFSFEVIINIGLLLHLKRQICLEFLGTFIFDCLPFKQTMDHF